jgi:hypothetical protein
VNIQLARHVRVRERLAAEDELLRETAPGGKMRLSLF